MERITVKGKNGYKILIEKGLISKAGEYVRQITSAKKAFIISDGNVLELYGKTVSDSLKANGFEVSSFAFEAGEKSKTLDTVTQMVYAMCRSGIGRTDIVVALGGGVVGDMAGFASAIYLRGIDFVQIPTTLLSQVDSSVGGKTGCDIEYGKNLVGAFHNPKLVLIDVNTLKTLPQKYLNDGLGEVIKYGAIKSSKLFKSLEECNCFDDIAEKTIIKCVDIKRQVVERDFTEKGERMLLNFGHTVGHAIEKFENFQGMSHGEAVGVGMFAITDASQRAGYTEKGSAQRIEKLLKKFSLPTKAPVSADQITDIMLFDKKRRDNKINLVLLKKIGSSFVEPTPSEKLKTFFLED